jgi:large subunit ribosomal protein L7/L12
MAYLQRKIAFATIVTMLLAACSAEQSQTDSDSRFTVVITEFDPDLKIQAIKEVRAATGLGLADAKNLIESTPSIVKTGLTRSEAEALATGLRAQRMSVELRPE